ncbi:MAG: ABC transporter permease subunit [Micromonosporaceae bacterium]
MRLLRAELTRLFSRRFTRVMLLVLVLVLTVIAGVLASQTRTPTPADLQRAEAQAADQRAQCRTATEDAPEGESACDSIQADAFLPYALDFRSEMPDLLPILTVLLVLFGYLVGASFLGAEWSSGGISQLLLWRVERTRVLLSKLLAVLLAVVGIGLALGAAWTAAIWFISHNFGRSSKLTSEFWVSLGEDGARGLALALLIAAARVAVASLGRRTAAALGLAIGYLVVWEMGARLVMMALGVPLAERYLLSSYVFGLLFGEYPVVDYTQSCTSMICEPQQFVIVWPWALALIGGISLLMVLTSVTFFRRRDIA